MRLYKQLKIISKRYVKIKKSLPLFEVHYTNLFYLCRSSRCLHECLHTRSGIVVVHSVDGRKTRVDHCMHVFFVSNFSIVTVSYHRVRQYVTFKFQYTQRCCTREQQLIYGYNCVLMPVLHCGFKDQLTPCDNYIQVV